MCGVFTEIRLESVRVSFRFFKFEQFQTHLQARDEIFFLLEILKRLLKTILKN